MNANLAGRLAATLRGLSLCIHCLAVKTSVTPQEAMDALPAVANGITLRIDALGACDACHSRRGVTYSLGRRQPLHAEGAYVR